MKKRMEIASQALLIFKPPLILSPSHAFGTQFSDFCQNDTHVPEPSCRKGIYSSAFFFLNLTVDKKYTYNKESISVNN